MIRTTVLAAELAELEIVARAARTTDFENAMRASVCCNYIEMNYGM